MREQLRGLEEKYLDLEAKLSNPEIVSDPALYQKYARQHAKLTEIVTVYREYRKNRKSTTRTGKPPGMGPIRNWRIWPGPRQRNWSRSWPPMNSV